MRVWELVRQALDAVKRTPLRITLTSLGVAIATGSLISMVGFALGIQEQVEEPFKKSELFNRIDVSVIRSASPGNSASAEDSTPKNEPSNQPVLDDVALTKMASIPGVVLAYPELLLGNVELIRGEKAVQITAGGLPPGAGRLRFVQDALIAGRFFDGDHNPEIILGKKLVKTLGFDSPEDAIGKTFLLKAKGLSPKEEQAFQFEERQVEVMVTGVWNPAGGRSGFRADGLVLPLSFMRTLPGVQFESALDRLRRGLTNGPGGYGRAVIRVERPVDLFDVEKKIQGMGFQTQTLLGQIKDIRKGFIIMDLVLGAVGTVALVVAGLGIINTQLMAVLERYQEIGTYKALGASDGDIRILFLAEASLVGLFGGIGGVILGRIVSWIIEKVVNAIAHGQGIEESLAFFSFPAYLLLGAIFFAISISLISGVYPASRAARVDPIRALRHE